MVPLDTGPGLVAFGIGDAAAGLAFLGRVGQGAEVKWAEPSRAGNVVGTLLVRGPKHSPSHSRVS